MKPQDRITIDPDDPAEQRRFIEQRRLFRIGLAVIVVLLSPSLVLLFAGWIVTAGIAANLAIFLVIWFVNRQTH
jgi:hypothetical protein